MEPSAREIERRIGTFREGLKQAGVKLTHQRLEILRELAQSTTHPDAETIHCHIRERVPTLSLDTVYRTLWMLLDLGLITTLGPLRGRARFDANMAPHHHYFCSKCGLTRDFVHEEFDRLDIPEAVKHFGSVGKVEVEVRGICSHCAQATNSSANA